MNEQDTAEFNTEGQPAFPVEDTEEDTSADSQSEEQTDIDPTQSEEGEENSNEEEQDDEGSKDEKDDKKDDDDDTQDFHEHPRWKQREKEWKERYNDQEKRHAQSMKDLRDEFDEKYGPTQKKQGGDEIDTSSPIPSWFGSDDPKVWEAYQKDLGIRIAQVKKEAKEEALGEINTKSQADQKKIDEATEYMNSEMEFIQNDKTINPDGVQIDRNKLLNFVLNYNNGEGLVDTKGRWNYRAGFQLMKAGMKASTDKKIGEKKKIAKATTSEKTGETPKPNITTSKDFEKPQNRPW